MFQEEAAIEIAHFDQGEVRPVFQTIWSDGDQSKALALIFNEAYQLSKMDEPATGRTIYVGSTPKPVSGLHNRWSVERLISLAMGIGEQGVQLWQFSTDNELLRMNWRFAGQHEEKPAWRYTLYVVPDADLVELTSGKQPECSQDHIFVIVQRLQLIDGGYEYIRQFSGHLGDCNYMAEDFTFTSLQKAYGYGSWA